MFETITLDQLRLFLCVAEEGSFSAAGRRLGRVQSAVSQGVANLESALGVLLFDRTGRRRSPPREGPSFRMHSKYSPTSEKCAVERPRWRTDSSTRYRW